MDGETVIRRNDERHTSRMMVLTTSQMALHNPMSNSWRSVAGLSGGHQIRLLP
jgi:hypothetical protein